MIDFVIRVRSISVTTKPINLGLVRIPKLASQTSRRSGSIAGLVSLVWFRRVVNRQGQTHQKDIENQKEGSASPFHYKT